MATLDSIETLTQHPKFVGFDILQTDYKHVGNHGIRVDVVVPKTPSTGKRPVVVRFHGGGLVMADSLLKDFWPQWLSDLALQQNAIIISPNYRLMPQANGQDIYDDIQDFWTWVLSGEVNKLLAAQKTPSEADISRILVAGESAGGLLSVNSALAHASEIRAAIAMYPSLDPFSDDFSVRRTDLLPLGHSFPESVIEKHLAATSDPNTPVSSALGPEYFPYMLAAVEHGRISKWYLRDSTKEQHKYLSPILRLEQPDVQVPVGGITIIQGRQDSVVPGSHSEPFVKRAKEVLKGKPGDDKVELIMQEGEHGFDEAIRYEEPWLKEAIKGAVETWLA